MRAGEELAVEDIGDGDDGLRAAEAATSAVTDVLRHWEHHNEVTGSA